MWNSQPTSTSWHVIQNIKSWNCYCIPGTRYLVPGTYENTYVYALIQNIKSWNCYFISGISYRYLVPGTYENTYRYAPSGLPAVVRGMGNIKYPYVVSIPGIRKWYKDQAPGTYGTANMYW